MPRMNLAERESRESSSWLGMGFDNSGLRKCGRSPNQVNCLIENCHRCFRLETIKVRRHGLSVRTKMANFDPVAFARIDG